MDNLTGFALFFASVPTSTKEKVLNPSAETLGKGLNGIVSLLANPFIKLGILAESDVRKYEENIYHETAKVKDINRDSSKQGLALQALEDSYYQIDKEDFRKYFSRLIAASLDKTKNNLVHPSFSVILKQMSSDDARLLASLQKFSSKYFSPYIPLVNAQARFKNDGGFTMMFQDSVVISPDLKGIIDNPVSISSLERLGLVKVNRHSELLGGTRKIGELNPDSNSRSFINGPSFAEFYSTIQLTDEYKKQSEFVGRFYETIEIFKGSVEITHLGKAFSNIIL